MKMFKGTEVIGVIFQNRTGWHRNGLDSIGMLWEYDRGFFEGREGLACHPLNGNTLQLQDAKGLGQREVNT